MSDEKKIDDMEIVLSGLSLRENAELVVYQKAAIDALRNNTDIHIKAFVDLYKKTRVAKIEVKDE